MSLTSATSPDTSAAAPDEPVMRTSGPAIEFIFDPMDADVSKPGAFTVTHSPKLLQGSWTFPIGSIPATTRISGTLAGVEKQLYELVSPTAATMIVPAEQTIKMNFCSR